MEYLTSNDNFSFEINTDIFETNIINLVILIVLLFVVIKNFLEENLNVRKKKIVQDIENAETRLADSNQRYLEAKKQWSQIDIVIQEINSQMEKTKQNVVKLKWTQAREDLAKRFTTAIGILRNRETKTFDDVIKEVSQKALTKVVLKLKKQLGNAEQSNIVNSKIKQLGD
uniref:ATP synthase CF0, subunit B n=1 Tax=Microzonia abyssicola TaxID=217214 RepID=UPI002E7995B0|nr:ATP synthase CF0, subunit B [Syringoderma abyssicola]WAM64995.1 ATP synthase CF0, subunit B [Syringoderma abyssicola]